MSESKDSTEMEHSGHDNKMEHSGQDTKMEHSGQDNNSENQMKEAEKSEEAKLRAKYPQVLRPGGSVFLQKRLQKGQKYFDSGDYNMAKAKGQKVRAATVPVVPQLPTGDAIPTPEDLPARKTSIVQSKLAANELS